VTTPRPRKRFADPIDELETRASEGNVVGSKTAKAACEWARMRIAELEQRVSRLEAEKEKSK
jgi:hypothetical protein